LNERDGVPLPLKIEEAINELLDYLWDDERKDFQDAADDRKQIHVFPSLVLIRRWLTNRQPSAPSSD
jgi:hypothetical protein